MKLFHKPNYRKPSVAKPKTEDPSLTMSRSYDLVIYGATGNHLASSCWQKDGDPTSTRPCCEEHTLASEVDHR